jgi:hypothetical protein
MGHFEAFLNLLLLVGRAGHLDAGVEASVSQFVKIACYAYPCGAFDKLVGWICWIRSLSGKFDFKFIPFRDVRKARGVICRIISLSEISETSDVGGVFICFRLILRRVLKPGGASLARLVHCCIIFVHAFVAL